MFFRNLTLFRFDPVGSGGARVGCQHQDLETDEVARHLQAADKQVSA